MVAGPAGNRLKGSRHAAGRCFGALADAPCCNPGIKGITMGRNYSRQSIRTTTLAFSLN
jgi:hypothetical protein